MPYEEQLNTAFGAIMDNFGGDEQYNMHDLTTLSTNGTMTDLFEITTHWLKWGIEAVW